MLCVASPVLRSTPLTHPPQSESASASSSSRSRTTSSCPTAACAAAPRAAASTHTHARCPLRCSFPTQAATPTRRTARTKSFLLGGLTLAVCGVCAPRRVSWARTTPRTTSSSLLPSPLSLYPFACKTTPTPSRTDQPSPRDETTHVRPWTPVGMQVAEFAAGRRHQSQCQEPVQRVVMPAVTVLTSRLAMVSNCGAGVSWLSGDVGSEVTPRVVARLTRR